VTLRLDAVGATVGPVEVSWTSDDALLYAVGIGAGLGRPDRELAFTTENSHGMAQQVPPTFAVVAAYAGEGPDIGEYDESQLVHAEQAFELHRPLTPAGSMRVTSAVTGIYDKGSGALVTRRTVGVDPADGSPVVTAESAMFIRGEGGFGGERGPADGWTAPDRGADAVVVYETRLEQALLYRLSGDRNPLHSDPWFAAKAGFERPILHGLCTYGIAGRALVEHVLDGEPSAFAGMRARFTAPVMPGDTLVVSLWHDDNGARFRVHRADGALVLDRGRFTRTAG
jgi:acyl dehydratase